MLRLPAEPSPKRSRQESLRIIVAIEEKMAATREPAFGLRGGEAARLILANGNAADHMPARARLLIRRVENSISTMEVDIQQVADQPAKLVLTAELACLAALANALARALDQADLALDGELTVRLGRRALHRGGLLRL